MASGAGTGNLRCSDASRGSVQSSTARRAKMDPHTSGASQAVDLAALQAQRIVPFASHSRFEVDIRIPNGLTDIDILQQVDALLKSYPEVSYCVRVYNAPAWTKPTISSPNARSGATS